MSQVSLASFSKPFLQTLLNFVFAFTFVYLGYCLLDALFNSGIPVWQGNSIWSHSVIDPTVASLGLGAFLLGAKSDLRKAAYLGILSFLASFLFFRLWIWILPLDKIMQFDPTLIPLFFPFHEALLGLMIGGMIGCVKAGWKQSGRYAFAGCIGMTLGFFLMDLAGKNILSDSPYWEITQMIVGSPRFYLYFVIPALIQGLVFGTSIGFAEISIGKNCQRIFRNG